MQQTLLSPVRDKLKFAWEDAIAHLDSRQRGYLASEVVRLVRRSVGQSLGPGNMQAEYSGPYTNSLIIPPTSDHLLSILEAEHEILRLHAGALDIDVLAFTAQVNTAFQAHLISFSLHENSRLVGVESHEMHAAVVEPTLYLLHSDPKFASAERAYQKALAELRERDAGDAITDAATALQEVLKALGCSGNALGDLLTSAKKLGLVRNTDSPLTSAIINWVATQRNHGEAHIADGP